MHPILEKQAALFEKKFPKLIVSINESPVGFRDERVEADGFIMFDFLRLSNLACMNAVLKMVVEETNKLKYDDDTIAICDILDIFSKIKKSLTNEQ